MYGFHWIQGQKEDVSDKLAAKILRHSDMFEEVKRKGRPPAADKPSEVDIQAEQEEAAEQQKALDESVKVQEIQLAIGLMTKRELQDWSLKNLQGLDIDMRKKLSSLR
jgi:hypothetical protein